MFVSHNDFAVEGRMVCEWGMGGYYSLLCNTSHRLTPPDYKKLYEKFGDQVFEKLPSWNLLSEKEQQKIQQAGRQHMYYTLDQKKLWVCLLTELGLSSS